MRFQVSIRSLLLIATAAAVVLVVLQLRMDYMMPEKVMAELNRVGAEAEVIDYYDGEEYFERPIVRSHLDPAGTCTGLRIKKVDSHDTLLAASRVKTAGELTIVQLAKNVSAGSCDFRHLRDLHLGNASNAQIREWVRAAPKLDHLSIAAREPLTPKTFATIGQITHLNYLSLSDTPVTAKHLAALGQLPAIRFISFNNCRLEPGVFDQLNRFPILTSLRLYGPSYDNRILNHVQRAHQVTSLDLMMSSIDDRGLSMIRNWSHLRSLDLYGCPRITPKCVPDLTGMQFLRDLNVLGTAVEDDTTLREEMGIRLQEWIM